MLVLLIAAAFLAAAAAGRDNPLFTHWSSFRVGSTVTHVGRYSNADSGVKDGAFYEKITLLEVKDDSVLLRSVTRWGDSERERTMTHRLMREADGQVEELPAEGVTIGGMIWKCSHYRITNDNGTLEIWLCPVIPGPAKVEDLDAFLQVRATAVHWQMAN
jgi:hypothetical protein